MPKKPSDDRKPEVELLLTGRSDYLDRLLADLEAGKIQISEHDDMNTINRPRYSQAGRVLIPRLVYDVLEMIRRSGVTNMFDLENLKTIAEVMDEPETVEWLTDYPEHWMMAVMKGAEADDER